MEITMFEGHQREFLYDGPPTPTMDELEDNNDTSANITNDQLEWLMNLSDISDAQDQLDMDAFIAEVLDNGPDEQDNTPQEMENNDTHDPQEMENNDTHDPQEMENNDLHNQDNDNPQEMENDDPHNQDNDFDFSGLIFLLTIYKLVLV